MSAFPQTWTSTVSHWQATNRGPSSLFEHNKEASLPHDVVDYVIIGGGMAGASLAYHLTHHPNFAGKVVVLEAKDVASGASGRNGGHVSPFSFVEWHEMQLPLEEGGAGLTADEALDVLQQERDNLETVTKLVKEKGWDCDFWRGMKRTVATNEKNKAEWGKGFKAWQAAHSSSPRYKDMPFDSTWIEDPVQAQKDTRLHKALAYGTKPTGSIHPHKLATCFVRDAIATGKCEFYSWCPVKGISEYNASTLPANGYTSTDGAKVVVDCGERGKVLAKNVVACTNAHTRHLFPGSAIDKHLTPYRVSATQVTPPNTYSGAKSLTTTYNIDDGPYLIQTPSGSLVFGPFSHIMADIAPKGVFDVYEAVDDSVVLDVHKEWMANFCKDNFSGWGEECTGEGAQRYWSGIICSSKDTLPLVGEIPEKDGIWICAGFQGHGMGRIPHLTQCLANTMVIGQWDRGIPPTYKISDERLKRASVSPPHLPEVGPSGIAKPALNRRV